MLFSLDIVVDERRAALRGAVQEFVRLMHGKKGRIYFMHL